MEVLRVLKSTGKLNNMNDESKPEGLMQKPFSRRAFLAGLGLNALGIAAHRVIGSEKPSDPHLSEKPTPEGKKYTSPNEMGEFAVNPYFIDFKNAIDGAFDPKGLPGLFVGLNRVVSSENVQEIYKNVSVDSILNSDGKIFGINYLYFRDPNINKDGDLLVSLMRKGGEVTIRVALNLETNGVLGRSEPETLENIGRLIVPSQVDDRQWEHKDNVFFRTDYNKESGYSVGHIVDLDKKVFIVDNVMPSSSLLAPKFTEPPRENPRPKPQLI